MQPIVLAAALALTAAPALADAPKVVAASAVRAGGHWTISVSLVHPDTGWDHYATEWDVLGPDDSVLGKRVLTHPHVEEQPFTRVLDIAAIPTDFDHVMIRVKCNLDGFSPNLYRLDIQR